MRSAEWGSLVVPAGLISRRPSVQIRPPPLRDLAPVISPKIWSPGPSLNPAFRGKDDGGSRENQDHGDDLVSTTNRGLLRQPELLRLVKQGTHIHAINIDGIDIDEAFEGIIAFNGLDVSLSEGALV